MTYHYKIDVHLLDTTTGKRAVYHTDHNSDQDPEPGVFRDYDWRDGNFSCDCNRGDFWEEAAGEEVWGGGVSKCGDGRFVVEKIVEVLTGKVLYTEPEPDA